MVIGHELVADPDWLNFFATHPQFVLDRLLIFDDIIPEDAVSIFVRQYAAATQEDVDAFLQALSQLETLPILSLPVWTLQSPFYSRLKLRFNRTAKATARKTFA